MRITKQQALETAPEYEIAFLSKPSYVMPHYPQPSWCYPQPSRCYATLSSTLMMLCHIIFSKIITLEKWSQHHHPPQYTVS